MMPFKMANARKRVSRRIMPALGLATTALLASSASALDIKGMSPGMTLAELQSKTGNAFHCSPSNPDNQTCQFTPTILKPRPLLDTVAGVPANKWVAQIYRDKVAVITAVVSDTHGATVLGALRSKWGQGELKLYSTPPGMKVPPSKVSWTAGDLVLSYTDPLSPSTTTGSLSLRSQAAFKSFMDSARSAANKDNAARAKDL